YCSNLVQSNPKLVQQRRAGFNTPPRKGTTANGGPADSLPFRQLLLKNLRNGIVQIAPRDGWRREGQDTDWSITWIDLAIRWIVRKVRRQLTTRRVDRGLHVSCSAIDVARQIEL